MASNNKFAIFGLEGIVYVLDYQGNGEGMKHMAEFLAGNLAYENRMILAQYVFIITLIYLAVIIIVVGIGQKTRILAPSTQSKISFTQREGNRTVISKCKIVTGPGWSMVVGNKRDVFSNDTTLFDERITNCESGQS